MLKTIKTNFAIIPENGVVYKRADIDTSHLVNAVKKKAEHQARKIIEKAKYDASMIVEEAYSKAYQDGMIDSVTDVIKYIGNCDEYVRKVHQEVYEEVKNILTFCVGNPDVLINAVNEWINSLDEDKEEIHLTLPKSYLEEEQMLISVISKNVSADVHTTFHEGSHITIFCGSHIAEFNPPEFINKTSDQIAESYNFIKQELHGLSRDTLKTIIDECQSLLDELGG